MSYTHLTAYGRGQIQALLEEGRKMTYIARVLGRSPSTITREKRRNSAKGAYVAQTAQQRYRERRVECRPLRKLAHRPLWAYVIEKLSLLWSPCS
jgi:IS30 family transposase